MTLGLGLWGLQESLRPDLAGSVLPTLADPEAGSPCTRCKSKDTGMLDILEPITYRSVGTWGPPYADLSNPRAFHRTERSGTQFTLPI